MANWDEDSGYYCLLIAILCNAFRLEKDYRFNDCAAWEYLDLQWKIIFFR